MKYDDASWHYSGDFPRELPNKKGATHIGMFFSWCLLNGLGSKDHTKEFAEEFAQLKKQKISPGEYFINTCDEKLTDEDLNEEGNKFARFYYESDEVGYSADYINSVDPTDRLETIYHIDDSWETYKKLAPIITAKYKKWKNRLVKKSKSLFKEQRI